MQNHDYTLGVDGGGTGCRARLTDVRGHVIGEGTSGPANLMLGIGPAWQSVLAATRMAYARTGLTESALARTRAGFGMAGANMPALRAEFIDAAPPMLSLRVLSDAETACLGAHGGQDGGILILGTGSQGVVYRAGRFSTVGGWGFAASDTGSGAVLGRAALRHALLAHEGVRRRSALTIAIMQRFHDAPDAVVEWASLARPSDWGSLAPLVIAHADSNDPVALELVRESAEDSAAMIDRMAALGAAKVSLMGGLSGPIRRYLPARASPWLSPPFGDAMDGALLTASGNVDLAG